MAQDYNVRDAYYSERRLWPLVYMKSYVFRTIRNQCYRSMYLFIAAVYETRTPVVFDIDNFTDTFCVSQRVPFWHMINYVPPLI